MKQIDMRFDVNIFKPLIGRTFEKYRCDQFMYTNSVTQIVGIYIGNQVYKMTNIQETIDYFGNREDMAVCNFNKCQEDDIKSAFKDTSMITIPVNDGIEEIVLVNENQQVVKNGVQTYDVWLTRGIIFAVGGREISFEKDITPFSEEIIIHRGYDLLNEFASESDFSEGWDEGIKASAQRELVRIK